MTTVLESPKQIEQKVILHGVSWQTYERLLAEHLESSGTRFTYDRGTLEIMLLSLRHERLKQTLNALVEIFAEELQIDFLNAGSTTFRREDLARGFEPDTCFYFVRAEYIRQKDEIDLTTDPPPELVVEVDITSPSLDKFSLFAALGVPEVWRYDGRQVGIFHLAASAYAAVHESVTLPSVTDAIINRLLEADSKMKRTDWLRLARESVPKSNKQ